MAAYSVWKKMLHRVATNPYYVDCKVCDEWMDFPNFEQFYLDNCHDETLVLDKDLLTIGNKTYCPEHCRFVPAHINTLFNTHRSTRGEYPVGVYLDKTVNKRESKYKATLAVNGRNMHLGYYNTPEEAYEVYRIAKLNRVKRLAIEALMQNKITLDIYIALIRRDVTITD